MPFLYRLPAALPLAALIAALAPRADLSAQAVLQGRIATTDTTTGEERVHVPGTIVAATPASVEGESLSFRSWETHPVGWFRVSGGADRYTVAFTNPAHWVRPGILTNVWLGDGDDVDLDVDLPLAFSSFHDTSWDTKPARGYLQTFTATGTGVTSVGFRLATDGVDGPGPGAQDVLVSVHRVSGATPDAWPSVGPIGTALDVDCGGPKGYTYSVGWGSGEVPTQPGEQYAIFVRPADPNGVFQAFWRERPDAPRSCWRIADGEGEYVDKAIWLAVGQDGDGLLVSYPKRVHATFRELTRHGHTWTQTWRAHGRGLAAMTLYAAVGGTQPPLSRQRVRVTVRRGGPKGEVVGRPRLAVGGGNYTGDASWGYFVCALEPSSIPLTPGETYALEVSSIETLETLGGFVNIKGQPSDERPGFNPYRKCSPDDEPSGEAYYLGEEPVDFDLDLELLEYEAAPADGAATPLAGEELLANGGMQVLRGTGPGGELVPVDWKAFAVDPGTRHTVAPRSRRDGEENLALRVHGEGTTIDGGWLQVVRGLDPTETYLARGRVRANWALDADHRCRIGWDPTGQTEDPNAPTIVWTRAPARHGEFLEYASRPMRPRESSISIWLRAECSRVEELFPFRAEFDDFSVRRIATEPPRAER